jgi:hypothetical protein
MKMRRLRRIFWEVMARVRSGHLFEHFQADLAGGDLAQRGHAGLVGGLDLGAWPWLSMRAR